MKRFARLRMIGGMALFLGVIAAVILLGSPYAPVVAPCPDIEEIWAIEDAREESETPLITRLECNGSALGYDWYENTFYCALGLENGDDWPSLHLIAPGAKNVSVCFVDDYSYDWCQEAIREGYAYQIIAYTDEAFSYSQIVFTGLPVMSITTDVEIPAGADAAGRMTLTYDAKEGVSSPIRTHKRGATTLFDKEKNGYKVEFTRNADGSRKIQQPIRGMGMTDEFVLISGVADQELMRDRLSWDLYNGLTGSDAPFGTRDMFYTELFINNRYQGVYLALRPFDYTAELAKAGSKAAQTDSIYRIVRRMFFDETYERAMHIGEDETQYALYYTPSITKTFEALEAYLSVRAEEDDQAFSEGVLRHFDIDSVIRYMLFIQAGGMTDNDRNNLYIWAHHGEAGMKYRFFPWDMDVSWGRDDEYNDGVWYPLPLLDRMLELDCGGVIRERTTEIWKEMRETVLTAENVERLIAQYTYEMGDSGAFYRDAVRWSKAVSYADGYNIYAYAKARLEMMDARIAEITSEALKGHSIRIEGYTTFDDGVRTP